MGHGVSMLCVCEDPDFHVCGAVAGDNDDSSSTKLVQYPDNLTLKGKAVVLLGVCSSG